METKPWNPATHPNLPLETKEPTVFEVEGDLTDPTLYTRAVLCARGTDIHVFRLPTTIIGHEHGIAASCDVIWGEALPDNVEIGVPIRTQADANRLLPELLQIDAKLFARIDPREPIDLDKFFYRWERKQNEQGQWECKTCDEYIHVSAVTSDQLHKRCGNEADWLTWDDSTRHKIQPGIAHVQIRGTDSPIHPEHVQAIVDQCRAAGVPVGLNWGKYGPIPPKYVLGAAPPRQQYVKPEYIRLGEPMPDLIIFYSPHSSGCLLNGEKINDLPRSDAPRADDS